jgi:hypothetical protein
VGTPPAPIMDALRTVMYILVAIIGGTEGARAFASIYPHLPNPKTPKELTPRGRAPKADKKRLGRAVPTGRNCRSLHAVADRSAARAVQRQI